jgi:hypothetical protein
MTRAPVTRTLLAAGCSEAGQSGLSPDAISTQRVSKLASNERRSDQTDEG